MTTSDKVVLVIGAGIATGGAVAKRFAREGYVACMARRQGDKLHGLVDEISAAGGRAHGYSCDATEEAQVVDLVERVEAEVGPIEVACYNAAVGASHSITEFPADAYERAETHAPRRAGPPGVLCACDWRPPGSLVPGSAVRAYAALPGRTVW